MSIRARTLREVASLLEAGLIKTPEGDAEEHVNDCYQRDIDRFRRMADQAEKEGAA